MELKKMAESRKTPQRGDYQNSPFEGGRGMFGLRAESPKIISVGQRPTLKREKSFLIQKNIVSLQIVNLK